MPEMMVNIGSNYGLMPDQIKPLCEPIMSETLWHSPGGNFTGKAKDISIKISLEILHLKVKNPRG